MEKNKELEVGIHFGISEEEYHALPYFSRSGAAAIMSDPEEFWHYSWLNPTPPEKKTSRAMELGTAVHAAVLETAKFNEKYKSKYTKEEFSEYGYIVLDKIEDFKKFLDEMGVVYKGITKKEGFIELAKKYSDERVIIWEDIKREEQADEEAERIILDKAEYDKIHSIADSVSQRNWASKFLELSTDGESEVVLIFDEQVGDEVVRCKAKMDRICLGEMDENTKEEEIAIVDLKTFHQKHSSVDESIRRAILYSGYYAQYYVYCRALYFARLAISKNKGKIVFHNDVLMTNNFLERLKKPELDYRFYFIFVKTEAPFQCRLVECRQKVAGSGSADNAYFTEGENFWAQALNNFVSLKKKYGKERWIDPKNEVSVLTDEALGMGLSYVREGAYDAKNLDLEEEE